MAEDKRVLPEAARRVLDIPNTRRTESIGDAQGKKLIVGREICLTGEISACDTLVVEGRVEAALSDSRTIEITETGVFKGEIEINVAEISGQFEGALTAHHRLVIQTECGTETYQSCTPQDARCHSKTETYAADCRCAVAQISDQRRP